MVALATGGDRHKPAGVVGPNRANGSGAALADPAACSACKVSLRMGALPGADVARFQMPFGAGRFAGASRAMRRGVHGAPERVEVCDGLAGCALGDLDRAASRGFGGTGAHATPVDEYRFLATRVSPYGDRFTKFCHNGDTSLP